MHWSQSFAISDSQKYHFRCEIYGKACITNMYFFINKNMM